MKKCKYCQAELVDEGNEICPQCGKDNAEAEEFGDQLVTRPLTEEMQKAIDSMNLDELVMTPSAQEAPEEQETETMKLPDDQEEKAEETADATEEAEAIQEPEENQEPEETVESEEAVEEAADNGQDVPKKATPGKIAAAVAAVVVLAAVLIALILSGMKGKEEVTAPAETTVPQATQQAAEATVPADGDPNGVTCQGSYTVSDEEAAAAKKTVVAKIGSSELTNGELQIYYWSTVNSYLSSEMGNMLMMYGMLDYTQPLDTMMSFEDESLTWQQFFLQEALNYWQLTTSMAEEAQKAGYEISQENLAYLEGVPSSLEATAASYGMSLEDLFKVNFGPGVGLEEFLAYQEHSMKGSDFYQEELKKMVPTQEDLEQFFDEHAEEYAQSGITKDGLFVDVRHILVQVKGGTTAEDGTTTYTDEEWETCRQAAQALLDQWLAGEKTEESFAALANTSSEDPGSNTKGGLYEDVYVGQMVAPFEEWCFDESRQYGDYGLVQTSYGYHVMFYVGSEPMWLTATESDWIQTQAQNFIQEMVAKYPMEVYYDKIGLGFVNMAG